MPGKRTCINAVFIVIDGVDFKAIECRKYMIHICIGFALDYYVP